jgi:hypothetical protein
VTKELLSSKNPRLYLDPGPALKEPASVGFTKVLDRTDPPATDQNGIPNIEAIIKKTESVRSTLHASSL